MKKIVALVTTFLLAVALVTEIRTQRAMQCFGCTNVKCVIRLVDENPSLLITHPMEVLAEVQQVPYWWD